MKFLIILRCELLSVWENVSDLDEFCYCFLFQLMIVTLLSQIVWLTVVLITGLPCLCWLILDKICLEELNDWNLHRRNNPNNKFSYTFNLTSYGEWATNVPLQCIDLILMCRVDNIITSSCFRQRFSHKGRPCLMDHLFM